MFSINIYTEVGAHTFLNLCSLRSGLVHRRYSNNIQINEEIKLDWVIFLYWQAVYFCQNSRSVILKYHCTPFPRKKKLCLCVLASLENNDLIHVIFGKASFSHFIYCMDTRELRHAINLSSCSAIFETDICGLDIVSKTVSCHVWKNLSTESAAG